MTCIISMTVFVVILAFYHISNLQPFSTAFVNQNNHINNKGINRRTTATRSKSHSILHSWNHRSSSSSSSAPSPISTSFLCSSHSCRNDIQRHQRPWQERQRQRGQRIWSLAVTSNRHEELALTTSQSDTDEIETLSINQDQELQEEEENLFDGNINDNNDDDDEDDYYYYHYDDENDSNDDDDGIRLMPYDEVLEWMDILFPNDSNDDDTAATNTTTIDSDDGKNDDVILSNGRSIFIPAFDIMNYWYQSPRFTSTTTATGGNGNKQNTLLHSAETCQRILYRCLDTIDMDDDEEEDGDTVDDATLDATSSRQERQKYSANVGGAQFGMCMNAWARSRHPDAYKRVTELVNEMNSRGIPKTDVTWNLWIKSAAVSSTVADVEQLVHRMAAEAGYSVNIRGYNILLSLYGKRGMAHEAEALIQQLVRQYDDGEIDFGPDMFSYTSLMTAWANERGSCAERRLQRHSCQSQPYAQGIGVRAERILDEIERRKDEWDYELSTFPYSSAIRVVARSGESNAASRILAIRDRAVANGVQPSYMFLAILLEAFSRADPEVGFYTIDEIIKEADNKVLSEINHGYGGKVSVYKLALKVMVEYMKDVCNDDNKARAVLEKANHLLTVLQSERQFDSSTYSTMIFLYAALFNGSCRNRSINEEKETAGSSLAPTTVAIAVEKLLADIHKDSRLTANYWVYNAAITAFANMGMMSRATELLNEMELSYQNRGPITPDAVTYTIMINGWGKLLSKSKRGEQHNAENEHYISRVEELIDRMNAMSNSGNSSARPTLHTYVSLVQLIAKSKLPGSANKAEKIVRSMYQSYRRGESSFKPTARMVSTVIHCWAFSGDDGAAERAEDLLNFLIDMYYDEGEDPNLLPNPMTFSLAILVWRDSSKFGKATRAKAIFDKMVKMNESGILPFRPDVYHYNHLFKVCARDDHDSVYKRASLQIFIDAFRQLVEDEDVRPNEHVYDSAMMAIRCLYPWKSDKQKTAMTVVFKKVISEGFLTPTILFRLRGVFDSVELSELANGNAVRVDGSIDFDDLPSGWSRNIKDFHQGGKRKRYASITR